MEESLAQARAVGDAWLVAYVLQELAIECHGIDPAGIPVYEESLRCARQAGDPWLIARGLWAHAFAIMGQGAYPRARTLLEECLAIQRQLGDNLGIARSLLGLEFLAYHGRDYGAAQEYNAERYCIEMDLDNAGGVGHTRMIHGWIALGQDDAAQAAACFEESLAIAREEGDAGGMIGPNLVGLGQVALAQGDQARAQALFGEGLVCARDLDEWDPFHHQKEVIPAACLEGLAEVETALYVEQGGADQLADGSMAGAHARRVARLVGAAQRLREGVFDLWLPVVITPYERAVAAACTQLDEATFDAAWAEGRAMTRDQAIAYALGETM